MDTAGLGEGAEFETQQVPEMEVPDIQEKPPQWFNNQNHCVRAHSMGLDPGGWVGRVVSYLSWGL